MVRGIERKLLAVALNSSKLTAIFARATAATL